MLRQQPHNHRTNENSRIFGWKEHFLSKKNVIIIILIPGPGMIMTVRPSTLPSLRPPVHPSVRPAQFGSTNILVLEIFPSKTFL